MNLKTLTSVFRNHPNQKCLSMIGRWQTREVAAPQGLILPFNDVVVPEGWSVFSNADGKLLVGAGDTYNIGDSGGSSSFSLSGVSGSAGNHSATVTSGFTSANQNAIGGSLLYENNTSGAHTHNLVGGTYEPQANEIVLIKADSNQQQLPAKAVLLSSGAVPSGLSNIYNNNKFLKANNTIAETGNILAEVELSTAGTHYHGRPYVQASWVEISAANYSSYGSHAPQVLMTCNEAIKKVQLSMWTNASREFRINNLIGMWESLTPPQGWVLCDGSNGTPDLRNYFIETVTSGLESSGQGSNQINIVSNSINHNASHHHQGSNVLGISYGTSYHTTYTWNHSHSLNINQTVAYLPSYYALSFIMKI